MLAAVLMLALGDARSRAEAEFAAGRYRAAADAYDELRSEGASNPELYLNIGNARYLSGDLPRAILAYRLGLRIAPDDETLRRHLEHARGQVFFLQGNPFGRPPEEVLPPIADRRVPFAALGSLALVAWAGARWAMVRRTPLLVVGLAALAVASAGLAWLAHTSDKAPRPVAVTTRDGVFLRKGDAVTFPPRYEQALPLGAEVEVLHRRGAWLLVELSGGEVGWVRSADVVAEEEGG